MPPLGSNRYHVLFIEEPTIDEHIETDEVMLPIQTPRKEHPRKPKWERQLPVQPVINALSVGALSLVLPVELETTDTAEKKTVHALVDSGATGVFIDRDFVCQQRLNTRALSNPILVFNVDGMPNDAGSISEVVDLLLHIRNYTEHTLCLVTSLGKQNMILGFLWLKKHNLEIDWQTGEVRMTWCPTWCCMECREESRKGHAIRKAMVRRIRHCSKGPVPTLTEDDDFEEEEPPEEEPLGEGDCIWAATLMLLEEISATSTTSQHLAEAFHRNSNTSTDALTNLGFQAHVPEYLHEYESVFSKESFNSPPDHRPWDHAIELIPGSDPTGCKVYPLSPAEQRELDAFIQENLSSGCIRPSKSPMSSPVFFVKKKDGSL